MRTDSEFLEPVEAAVGADPSISRSGDPSATIDIEDMEEEEIGMLTIPFSSIACHKVIHFFSAFPRMTIKALSRPPKAAEKGQESVQSLMTDIFADGNVQAYPSQIVGKDRSASDPLSKLGNPGGTCLLSDYNSGE